MLTWNLDPTKILMRHELAAVLGDLNCRAARSGQYKAIGWGLMNVAFVLMLVVSFGAFALGFRPERPGGGNQGVGLTRSQTAEVLERIRASHAASPTADVVRTVSFPVWSTMRDDGAAEAERVLGSVPGYVGGSFRLSPDRKKAGRVMRIFANEAPLTLDEMMGNAHEMRAKARQ